MNEYMRPCKIIYVLLDGVGDLAHPGFGNMTPLEVGKNAKLGFFDQERMYGQCLKCWDWDSPSIRYSGL